MKIFHAHSMVLGCLGNVPVMLDRHRDMFAMAITGRWIAPRVGEHRHRRAYALCRPYDGNKQG
ncbi:MAG: hypothetical protein Q8O86_10400 [Dehalococcoidia bacterium]|nr:hypothetical protein [Dehalococcoidia bacterium]